MRLGFWVVAVLLLSVASAAAQQARCRPMYRLGEAIPPGCQDRQKTGLPPYLRWGEGYGATPAMPAPPPVASEGHEWRYFGGHNAVYGFGR